MDEKLGIFVCANLAPEVAYVLQSGDYPDVKLMTFPNSCIGSPINNELISLFTNEWEAEYSKILFFAGSCRTRGKDNIFHNRKIEMVHLKNCFEIILNKEIIDHFIRQGYYLVTNGWLNDYQHHIDNWGFQEKTAKVFFRESLKKILFLDGGLPGDYHSKLRALSDYMGLPFEIFPVGIGYCTNYFEAKIMRWRAECERNRMNERLSKVTKENADYFFIFKQLQKLVDYTDESFIVKEIFELLNILFAPSQIGFQKYLNDHKSETIWSNSSSTSPRENLSDYMSIEIVHQNEMLGVFEIYGIRYPEYMGHYKTIIPLISKIGGIAITNARKYKIIHDQKEQLQIYSGQLGELVQSKDKFFSIIAHDLRSPFNSFLGLTQLMAEDLPNLTITELQEMTVSMSKSATNLHQLLENLLQWSQIQQGAFPFHQETISLQVTTKESIEMIQESARNKGIKITTDIPDGLVVYADLNMFQTIIRNLVSNAIKFTPKGGKVILSAMVNRSERIEIIIRDTGIGMSPEIAGHLFRIDVKTNRPGTEGEPSAGLGLLLCKEFIEIHGGNICVESEEGKGSVFTFSIPGHLKEEEKDPFYSK